MAPGRPRFQQPAGLSTWLFPPRRTPRRPGNRRQRRIRITSAAEKFIEDHRDGPFFRSRRTTPALRSPPLRRLVDEHRDAFHPLYAAMIETLDQAVGRLMVKVESRRLTDRPSSSSPVTTTACTYSSSPARLRLTIGNAGKGFDTRRRTCASRSSFVGPHRRRGQPVRHSGRANRPRPSVARPICWSARKKIWSNFSMQRSIDARCGRSRSSCNSWLVRWSSKRS